MLKLKHPIAYIADKMGQRENKIQAHLPKRFVFRSEYEQIGFLKAIS